MEDTYLVEIRLGRTKWRIRELIRSITGSFGIEQCMEPHPHVTLFGPLVLNEGVDSRQLLDAVSQVASSYEPVPFLLDGFEKREGLHGGVLAIAVRPSGALKSLVADLAPALLPICRSLNAWDAEPERKWFHVTIANRLSLTTTSSAFSSLTGTTQPAAKTEIRSSAVIARIQDLIRRFLPAKKNGFRPVLLDETGLRITVMHGEEILAEYDLAGRCWIFTNPRQDSASWKDTLAVFRKEAGFERVIGTPAEPEDIFLIADLHLGHANIIRYCSRPFLFADVAEMDRVLIGNWNSVISPGTPAYHLGDLRFGNDARPAGEYRRELNGSVTFIAGNHDEPDESAIHSCTLDYDGEQFLLVHDPADAPPGFSGWVIHGHHHNNDLRKFPFISFEDRRINVSAEVVGYVPVSLKAISAILRFHREHGNTAPILFHYPCGE
jgi:calcineurin-like phosphoesterase family protein